jgi:hypothetical protein
MHNKLVLVHNNKVHIHNKTVGLGFASILPHSIKSRAIDISTKAINGLGLPKNNVAFGRYKGSKQISDNTVFGSSINQDLNNNFKKMNFKEMKKNNIRFNM